MILIPRFELHHILASFQKHRPQLFACAPRIFVAQYLRHDCDKEPRALVDEFVTLRRERVALVRKIDAAALHRSGVHGKVGELFVPNLLHEWVHHDRNHTKQLLSVGMARVWPHMATAQKFQDHEGGP